MLYFLEKANNTHTMTQKKTSKFWAIGFSGWVELRESPTRPRSHPSETIIIGGTEKKPTRLVLKQVTHTGGDIVGCVKTWIFEEVMHKYLKPNQVLTMTPEQVKLVLARQAIH